MTWIFDACTDQYGSCIRQYVMFSVSLIVLALALFSCISILRRDNQLGFEILPIAINTITSLIIFGIYTQIEVYNIRIIMLIFEVYSYFILSYGFVYMVFRQNSKFKRRLKKMKIVFVSISVVSVLAIISVVILSNFDIIRCSEDQGIGSIVLTILEIPLFLVTYIYSRKSRAIIKENSHMHQTEYTHQTQHLLDGQDQSKKIKLLQLKLVRFVFVVSFVLHAIQLYCYFIGDEEIICSDDTHKIAITNPLQLYILCVENISELFPHFIIPFIFWYLPARIMNRSATLYMSSEITEDYHSRFAPTHHNLPKIKINRTESKLVNDVQSEEEIRQRLRQQSPERHVHRIQTL